mmetsp:Transcript_48968/g.97704  ORF Transcript_48968/g.97704 Transcript_48968/m.97704 type:complete len:204 (+) Transcript_48968:109-720(+)
MQRDKTSHCPSHYANFPRVPHIIGHIIGCKLRHTISNLTHQSAGRHSRHVIIPSHFFSGHSRDLPRTHAGISVDADAVMDDATFLGALRLARIRRMRTVAMEAITRAPPPTPAANPMIRPRLSEAGGSGGQPAVHPSDWTPSAQQLWAQMLIVSSVSKKPLGVVYEPPPCLNSRLRAYMGVVAKKLHACCLDSKLCEVIRSRS